MQVTQLSFLNIEVEIDLEKTKVDWRPNSWWLVSAAGWVNQRDDGQRRPSVWDVTAAGTAIVP